MSLFRTSKRLTSNLSRRRFSSASDVLTAELVTLDYADLIAQKDLREDIEKAYSFDGLGILAVLNVPTLKEKRGRLLPLARAFAELPDDIKQKYELPGTFYSFGWSHGREKLQGKPDYAKGSYYANPQYDRPVEDEALIKQFAPFIHPNVWPDKELPQLEPSFKELGQLVVDVGALVGKQCDNFVQDQCPGYENNKLFDIISTSKCCKGRLLHYFAKEAETSSSLDDLFSDWCGWHNDHGSLTGLIPAMYLDRDGNEISNPDPNAGLYIRSRDGTLIRAAMPVNENAIAFQIGETAQIHSGGLLQATPHAVRGAEVNGVTRETFAVFMEPNWDGDMKVPRGRNADQAQSQASASKLPPGVPAIGSRWKDGMDFGQFTDATLKEYY
jgi:isopenicillin N synthase-like dioxygenase